MGIIFSFFRSEIQTLSPPDVFKLNSTNNNSLKKEIILIDTNKKNGTLYSNTYIKLNNNNLNNKQFVVDFPQEDNLQLFLTVVLNGKLISGNLKKYDALNVDSITQNISSITENVPSKFTIIQFPIIPINELHNYYNNIENRLNLPVANEYGKFLIYYSYLRTNDLYECIYLMKYLFPYFNYCFYLNEKYEIMKRFKKVSGVPLVIRVFNIFRELITPYLHISEFKQWILNILQENSGSPNETDINVNFINIMRDIYKNIDYTTDLKLIADIYKYDIIGKDNQKVLKLINKYKKLTKYNSGDKNLIELFVIITKQNVNNLTVYKDLKDMMNKISSKTLEKVNLKNNSIPREDIKVKNSTFSTKTGKVSQTKLIKNSEVLPLLNSMNKDLAIILQDKYKSGHLKKYVFNPTFKKNGKSVFNAIKKLYDKSVLGMTNDEINFQKEKNSNRIVGYFKPIYKNKYSETQIKKIVNNYFSIMEDVKKKRGIEIYPQDWFQNVFLGIILDNSFYKIYFRAYQMVPYDFFLIEGDIMMNQKIIDFFTIKYKDKENTNLLLLLGRQHSLMFYGQYIEKGLSIDEQYLNKLKIGYSYADYTQKKCRIYYEKYGLSYMEYSINLLDIICAVALVNKDKFYEKISNNNNKNDINDFVEYNELSNNIFKKFKYYYIKSLNDNELDQKCKDALKIMPEFYNYLIKNGVVSESAKEEVKKQKKYITSIITQPIKFD